MPPRPLLESLDRHARQRPADVALIGELGAWSHNRTTSETASFTWFQLACAVHTTAKNLSGLASGTDRCFVHASDNRLADVLITLAVMRIGGTESPLDHRLPNSQIASLSDQLGGYWIDGPAKDAIEKSTCDAKANPGQLGSPPAHDDSQSSHRLILWTSGTSGSPKGVVLSQHSLAGNAAAKLAAVPQRIDDIRLTSLPLSHAYARTCDMGTWLLSGCSLAVTLGFAGWERHGNTVAPTLANVTPSLADRLMACDSDRIGTRRVRILGCGGAALSEPSFREWTDRGVSVVQGYGLTEAAPVICSATPNNGMPGHVGLVVDGWETKIRDSQLFVRGRHVMDGYWKDDQASAEKVDADGWLATGDIVRIDPASDQYQILGRADDVIVLASGRKVHPRTIETIAERFAEVTRAVAVQRDGEIDLWLDMVDDQPLTARIHQALHNALGPLAAWERPRNIHKFAPPLTAGAGELTAKGTPRRNHIIANRDL